MHCTNKLSVSYYQFQSWLEYHLSLSTSWIINHVKLWRYKYIFKSTGWMIIINNYDIRHTEFIWWIHHSWCVLLSIWHMCQNKKQRESPRYISHIIPYSILICRMQPSIRAVSFIECLYSIYIYNYIIHMCVWEFHV